MVSDYHRYEISCRDRQYGGNHSIGPGIDRRDSNDEHDGGLNEVEHTCQF